MKVGIEGQSVSRVCFDAAVTLSTDLGYELRVETGASIGTAGGAGIEFEPGNLDSVAHLLAGLVGATIRRAEASDSGVLTLELDRGVGLVVPPDDDYEAWSTVGPQGERVVCMPGGGLSIWH